MKKLSIILILFIMFFQVPQIAEAASSYYGKVKSGTVYFYDEANSSSTLFQLPYSYFVQVTGIEDDEFFTAVYKDMEGYVKKSDVTLMNGQPNNPYFNATFTNYAEFDLYESPETTSALIQSFSKEQTFNFYGTIEGEEVADLTNIWYYCSTVYNGENIKGYFYSGVASSQPEITINTETFEEISEDVFTATTNGEEFSALSTGTKILLIISILVPSVFILFFLIKPSKMNKQNKAKKGIRKVQHGDYFEFDDKDL